MQEIGGYFGLERFGGNEYHSDAFAFNTATNALLWLMEKRRIRRIWMPDYLCASVIRAVEKSKMAKIRRYEIDSSLQPNFPAGEMEPQDAVYLVNYYGQLAVGTVEQWREKTSCLIVDNVQAFFAAPVVGVDTLYSCRKWFGVPDGAYLYADGLQETKLPPAHAADHFLHLLGRFEGDATAWYREYQRSETLLEQSPICGMSELTRNILRAVDYERVSKRRTENFSFLHRQLGEKNQLQLQIPLGAFMYPFCIESTQAQKIRQRLLENKIYIPVLWPEMQGGAQALANRILPLPVDQRYTEKEMRRIVEIVKQ